MIEFNEIYDLHAKQVYRYLLTLCQDEYVAEEVMQETFYRAYKNIKSFQGKCSLYTWLCRIAKNCMINYQKKKRNYMMENNFDEYASANCIEKILIDKDQALQIHKALHKLQEPYKEVFALKVFGELKYREIAEIFGKSENWAKVTCYRAKEQILKKLEE